VPWFHLWLPNSPLDWRYVTEPQPSILRGFKDNVRPFSEFNFIFALNLQSIFKYELALNKVKLAT
jgi:hypothetical protein